MVKTFRVRSPSIGMMLMASLLSRQKIPFNLSPSTRELNLKSILKLQLKLMLKESQTTLHIRTRSAMTHRQTQLART